MSLTINPAPCLIQYAGDDRPARPRKGLTPPTMFAMGYDTAEIAGHLGISEAAALKLVNEERSRRIGRYSPYEVRN